MKLKQLRTSGCFWLASLLLVGSAQAQAYPLLSPEDHKQAQLPLANLSNLLQLRRIQFAPEGLLLMINGNPQVNLQRIVNPDRVVVDLQGTLIQSELHGSTIPINRYGIRQIRLAQFQKDPAIARIVLDFEPGNENSRLDWRTSFNPLRGGLLLSPTGGVNNSGNQVSGSPPTYSSSNSSSSAAVIQSLSLNNSGQLTIQANQALNYRGSEDLPSGTYNLSISPAQISPQLQRPLLAANSPVERVRLTQVGSSVIIGLKVTSGWQVRESSRSNPQQVNLQLVRSGTPVPPPVSLSQPQLLPVPVNPVPVPVPVNPVPVPPVSAIPNRGRGVVVVDAGHGGPDVGAIANGIYEKNVVLPISLQLGRILQQMGFAVVYTRTTDIDLDLMPRVNLAQQAAADVFVSIHANSLESRLSHINGLETYHSPNASAAGRQLAQLVHTQILAGTGASDRGVRAARFVVIHRTTMPSILVETGFITNPQEAANLNNKNYQDRMALAIARGIDQFMRSYGR